jgi:hypothetical protein
MLTLRPHGRLGLFDAYLGADLILTAHDSIRARVAEIQARAAE